MSIWGVIVDKAGRLDKASYLVGAWNARRQFGLQTREPLSPIYAQTAFVLTQAITADHPTWTQGWTSYSTSAREWWASVENSRMIIGKGGFKFLTEARDLLKQVEIEVFGDRRVVTGDPEEDDRAGPAPMSLQNRAGLNALLWRLHGNPFLLTK